MARESIFDEGGELVASFCPTDTPLSERGREALAAVVRAIRRDMAGEASGPCCDLHNANCEPPSELCCGHCGEVEHPEHAPGVVCVLDAAQAADKGRGTACRGDCDEIPGYCTSGWGCLGGASPPASSDTTEEADRA